MGSKFIIDTKNISLFIYCIANSISFFGQFILRYIGETNIDIFDSIERKEATRIYICYVNKLRDRTSQSCNKFN